MPLGSSVLKLLAQHHPLVTWGTLIARAGSCQLWVKAWFSSCGFYVMAGLIITPSVGSPGLSCMLPHACFLLTGSISTEYQLPLLPRASRLWDLGTRRQGCQHWPETPRSAQGWKAGPPCKLANMGCSPCLLLEARSRLSGSRGAARREEEEGPCTLEGPAVRANPFVSSSR